MTSRWSKALFSAAGAVLVGFTLLALVDGPEGALDQLLTLAVMAVAIGAARLRPRLAYIPALFALLIIQWPLVAPNDAVAAALTGRSNGLILAAERTAASGGVDEARRLLDRAVRANPRNARAKATSAALYLAMGQADQAYGLASAALGDYQRPNFTIARTRPDRSKQVALYVAGKAAAELGYVDDAMVRLTQAALADPENGLIHWELAGLYARAGLWDEAVRAYERVISLAGSIDRATLAQAYRLRGEALVRLGRLDEAAFSLRTSAARNPADGLARLDLGAVKLARGQVTEAMADLREARDILRAAGDQAAAQADQLLDQACQFLYRTYAARGQELVKAGDYAAARQWLNRALALAPWSEQAELKLYLGQADWGLGRYDEALAIYREAARLAPHNPRTRHSLGWALGAVGQFEEAEDEVKAAISMYPPGAPELPSAHSLLGVIYELTGRRQAARAEYLLALSLDPSDARARSNLERVAGGAETSGSGR